MPDNPWYKNPKVWIASIAGVLGVLVALGVISVSEEATWLALVERIIGAIFGIGASAFLITRRA